MPPKAKTKLPSSIDPMEDAVPVIGDNALKTITSIANELYETDQEIAALQASLAILQDRRNKLASDVLPNALSEVGLRDFTLENGVKVQLKEGLTAGVKSLSAIKKISDPAERGAALEQRQKAIAFLRKMKAADIIKHEISISTKKGEEKKAKQILLFAKKQGVKAEDVESVHPQTLVKFIREKLEGGEDVPFDLFSVYQYRVAELIVPSKKE